MGNDVRGLLVTGLGQMDRISSPVVAPFFAIPGFQVIGRGNHDGRWGKVLMVTPAELFMLMVVLLDPHLPQNIHCR
jgi:hypothetical protein